MERALYRVLVAPDAAVSEESDQLSLAFVALDGESLTPRVSAIYMNLPKECFDFSCTSSESHTKMAHL